MKTKLKILELTNYSAGICGVWQRVKQEAELLSKKYEVAVFSSNAVKGSNRITSNQDKIGKVKIRRFPFKKLGGESFMSWNFEKQALAYKPDIIIAHAYRHPHTIKALKITKKINAKCFLVTHAPFIKDNATRTIFSKISVNFYDKFIGPKTLNKFDKIIAITKWEIPYLLKLGCKKEKIICIPNGIPEEFFKQKKSKKQNKIIFLGRISPIKNLETLIKSISLIRDKKIVLEIIGPAEENYLKKLRKLTEKEGLKKRVIFSKPVYNLKEKIKKIDSCKIFILPSIREAMPQSLIEAMAREKVVIASNNPGTRDLLINGKNGYLFDFSNTNQLADKINLVLEKKQNSIKKQAKGFVKKFSWPKIIKSYIALFEK